MKRLLVILSALCLTLGGLAGCQKHEHIFSQATCTEPATCEKCGDTYGEALGHDFSDATCTLSKTCNLCGITEGEALGHTYRDASCTTPAICLRCDAIKGEPLGHNLTEATCTAPETCKNCGIVFGIPLGHSYSFAEDAACTDHMICGRCGKESTTVLGHMMVDATCEMTEYCTRCGLTGRPALGHDYREATCIYPQICKRCEEPNGSALGHSFGEATCTESKICSVCGEKEGDPLGHTYLEGACIRCDLPDPELQFENLYVIDKTNYNGVKKNWTDSYGNTYDLVHEYYQKITSSGGEKPSLFSMHNLDGKYTSFSGSLVAGKNMNNTIGIYIYVDDELVFKKTGVNRQTGTVTFNLDVTNASTVKIRFWLDEYRYGFRDPYPMFHMALVDTQLTK